VQQLKPLRRYLHAQVGHARNIAARSVEAGNKSECDRISCDLEHNRNGSGRRLRSECRRGGARDDYGDLTMNQIGRKCRQPIVLILCKTVFDRDVLMLDIASVLQALTDGG
jgi:hypothetical protein